MGNETKQSRFSFGKKAASVMLSTALFATTFASVGSLITVGTAPTVEAANEYGLADNIQDGVILHCFDWKYNDIKAELPNIAAAGFTAVQTSPAQAHTSSGVWYWAYQPLGFYIGNNEIGNKEELQALCQEAENYGIKIIVDVVANHCAGGQYPGNDVDPQLKNNNSYWHYSNFTSNPNDGTGRQGIDWRNRWQVTNGDIGMPDLATENQGVQNIVKNYIQELKGIGVDGIRFDAIKHIGLPSEGDGFLPAVTSVSDMWYYGEILVGPDDRETGNEGLMKEYTNYISVTDSDYGSTVRNSFASGSVTTSYGNWAARGIDNNKLVYWGESHDTWANAKEGDYSWNKSQNVIDRAYAVAAARNEITALYFSRPLSNPEAKENTKLGVKGSTSFTNKEVAQVNKFHNAMIGQKDYYTTGDNCSVITREKGAVIVAGSGGNRSVTVPNGGSLCAPGTYTDQVSGSTWTVTATTISGQIGDTGIAVIYNPSDTPVPIGGSVSASPSDTTFTDTLSVTLSVKNATNATYSTSEGASGSFTNGQKITIGNSTAAGGKVTLTLKATGEDGKQVTKTYTYTKKDPNAVTTVYFDNSSYSWSTVYAYIYTGDGTTAQAPAKWPGTQMTKDSATGYYMITIPEGYENGRIIFTESETATTNRYPADQAPGLEIGGSSKLLSAGNSWKDYTSPTPDPVGPSIKASVASGSQFTTETMSLTLTLSNAKSGTYSIDGNAPTKFTGSKTITIGEGKISDTTVKVVVTAADGTETVTETLTYNKVFDPSVDYNTAASGTLASQYSTNSNGFGVKKTISIDGSISDWDSSMLIAQGAANDDPRVYRDNSMYELPIDLYALYAAYDENNLYLMWEMTNVQDVVAPMDNYPLSQGILWQTQELPFFIFVDTGKSDAIGNKGALQTKGTIWDSGVTLSNSFNRLISINTKGGNGPYVYEGDSSGLNPVEVLGPGKSKITMDYGIGIVSKTVKGIDGAYGASNKRVVGDVCNNSAAWVDFNTKGHSSSSMDFFYEMSIPYSELGITLNDVENNGIGVLVAATFGKSPMDCLPYDVSMNDNADQPDTGSQENNSFEKSDEDYITTSFARVGKSGGNNPNPSPNPGPDPSPVYGLAVNFGASLSAPQATGTSMTLSAKPYNAVGSCTYKFSVNGTVLQNSSKSSVAWKPTKSGSNIISVTVTDSQGNKTTVSKKFTVTGSSIDPDVSITSLTASKTSATVGDSITLKTTATGSNLKYKYMVQLDGTWTTIRSASTTSSYTWKPTKAGTYTVRVVVTDGKNEARKEVTVKVSAGVTISSLTASKTSATVGDSITLKTTATGSNLKYKYMVQLDGTWTTIRSASTTSSYTWKPTKAGTYTVRVVVTDGKNEARKEVTVKVSAGVKISSLTASKTSAAVGDSITLKTTATGSNLKYKYMVCLNGTWTTVRSASTTSSYTWKPTKAGTYTVRVVVTDGKNEARKEVTVKVSAGVTISSLTASKTSATVGDSITLKTTATGSNLKYKYMVQLDGTWTTIRSASTTSSYTWKPTKAGTYTVRVVVTDGKNEARKEVTVKVSAGVKISSLTASKTTATVGDSITLKTTATGSNLKYKYMVCLNGTWTTVRSASTTSSYTWKPTKAGTYTVRVVVTDGKNEARKEVTVKVSAGVTISSLTASKTSATVGDSITLKTTATGSNLKYKYMVCLDGTWTTIRAASTTSSYTWKPTKAGTYTVRVVVTDGKNEARKEVTVKVSAGVKISSLTASKTSAAVGDSITLKTTATGSNLKYKYMVCLNGTWTTVRSASTTSSYTWKPTKAGTYTVRVVVTDGKNEARKEVTVKVSAASTTPKITSFTVGNSILTLGSSTTLKTTATGSNLKYKYMVQRNGGSWTTIKSSDTTSSYTWKPTQKGTYIVRVVVTDGKTEVREDMAVIVS